MSDRRVRAVCAVLCLLSAPARVGAEAAPGATVEVSGRTDRRQVTIGTPFRYTVEVASPEGFEVIVPVLGRELGEFSVVDFGEEPTRREAGRIVAARWYALVAYRPGYLLIPTPTVQFRSATGALESAHGADIGITVVSLLEREAGAEDIRDIKGPVSVPVDWTPVWLAAAALAALAAAGVLVARLVRRINAPAAAAPPKPPDLEALEALARLRHESLEDPAQRAQWYVSLSGIVRLYIERRFGLRAPEMTTEEFIQSVQRDSPLSPAHRESLGGFLAECDLVKFARVLPEREAAERAFAAARDFVNQTRPADEGAQRAA